MKNKVINLIVVLLLSIFGYAQADETSKYKGVIVKYAQPLKNYEGKGGRCIATNSSSVEDCMFSIIEAELTIASSKKIKAIFLESNHNSPGAFYSMYSRPSWKIEDGIELPRFQNDDWLDLNRCSSPSYKDSVIIGYGKWNWRKFPDAGGYIKPIEKAWRIDTKKRKIIPIATDDVVCEFNRSDKTKRIDNNKIHINLTSYLGMILSGDDKFPNYQNHGGECLDGYDGSGVDCNFSMSEIEIKGDGNKKIQALLLMRTIGRNMTHISPLGNQTNNAYFEVKDIIELLPYDKKQNIGYEKQFCTSSKFKKSKIIGYGKWNWRKNADGEGYIKPIIQAWRIDFRKQKFEEIDPNSVECELESGEY